MDFDDRKKAFETKFTVDQETAFRIEARASKLIGLWAAGKMGLNGAEAEAYGKEVIIANLDEPGYNDVKRKIVRDFDARGVTYTEGEVDSAIEKAVVEATQQVEAEKH